MQRRRSRSIWLVPAVVAVFSACSREPGSAADAGVAGRYLVPRTAWGDPDLQGMWPIDKLNGTPVQRPESFGERRTLTEAEFAERVERLRGLNARYDQEIATNKMGIGHWAEMGEPNRLTSLIMEPANGRLPPLTAEGERRSATMTSSWSDIPFDQVSDFNALDRCITRGMPASMFPFMYNSGIEIMQAPGYVVIRLELVHETRVVPVDGRDAARTGQSCNGSANRAAGSKATRSSSRRRTSTANRRCSSSGPAASRFRRAASCISSSGSRASADDTIDYEIAVEDPVVLMQPWKAAFPLQRDDDYRMFEYACHEDNSAVRNFIEASRFERRQRVSATP